MGGTLTSLRPERKSVVLWTPWGAIPRTGFKGLVDRRKKLHNSTETPRRKSVATEAPARG